MAHPNMSSKIGLVNALFDTCNLGGCRDARLGLETFYGSFKTDNDGQFALHLFVVDFTKNFGKG